MMIIVYLAAVLIIVGILFIFTSVEKRTVPIQNEADFDSKNFPEPDSIDLPLKSDVSALTETELPPIKKNEPEGFYSVVVYKDENGVSSGAEADADNGNLSLQSVTRIGHGVAEILDGSIILRIEKKLFRYDFYRIDSLIKKGQALIVTSKGVKGCDIIYSEDNTFFQEAIDKYNRYESK